MYDLFLHAQSPYLAECKQSICAIIVPICLVFSKESGIFVYQYIVLFTRQLVLSDVYFYRSPGAKSFTCMLDDLVHMLFEKFLLLNWTSNETP